MKQINRRNIKKILLVFERPKNPKQYINSLPPLGILYLDAVLEKNGFITDVVDANIDEFNLQSVRDFDLIGFSLFSSNVESSIESISLLRKKFPEKHIIIGGPHCAFNRRAFLDNRDINAIFIGESEDSLLEYLTMDDIGKVKGCYHRESLQDSFVYNGVRKSEKNLDRYPFPSFHKLDLKKYNYYPKRNLPIASIMTSRGCPDLCVFCLHNMGFKWRARSAVNVVDEIEYLVKKMGVREICIYDDNFTLDKIRTIEICNLIKERKISVKLQLTNGIRVNECDDEIIKALKSAGVWFIGVAPESGDAYSLEQIRKGFVHEDVLNVVRLCKKYNIKTYAFFIMGFPWENAQSFQNTINFALNLDPDMVQFSRIIAYNGTRLAKMYKTKENEGNPLMEVSHFSNEIQLKNDHGLTSGEIEIWVKRCYRSFYFRPSKIFSLAKTLGIKDLIRLGIYALKTGNLY